MHLATLLAGIVVVLLSGNATAATITYESDPDYDGHTKESGVGTGVGLYYDDSGTIEVGDAWNDIRKKAIFSFDTSSLPTGAVVTGATLRLRLEGGNGAPFDELDPLEVEVFRGSFGGDVALVPSDFEAAAASPSLGDEISDPGAPVVDFSHDLAAGAEPRINDAGWTQLRLFFTGVDSDSSEDRLEFPEGGETYGPELEIDYNTGEEIPGFIPPNFEETANLVDVDLDPWTCHHTIDDTLTSWSNVPWSTKTIICIEPGDYTSLGTLVLDNISGTATTRKVLRYYDSNDLYPNHPVQRADSNGNEAVIDSFDLEDSDYWTFDGLTVRDGDDGSRVLNASHNILNLMLFEDIDDAFLKVRNESDETVIQNSVFRSSFGGRSNDRSCLSLYVQSSENSYDPDREMEGTLIVDNEFINCNDGIQLVQNGTVRTETYYPGTVIENNDIYLTEDVYTLCDGELDAPLPSGETDRSNFACACAENALDIKASIHDDDLDDDTKRVKVLNNRMWGYRPTDNTLDTLDEDNDGKTNDRLCASGSTGQAVTAHLYARQVLFQGNVIWDSPEGIQVSGAFQPEDDIAQNYVVNNLISGMHSCRNDVDGLIPCTADDGIGLSVGFGEGNHFYGNTVIDAPFRWALIRDAADRSGYVPAEPDQPNVYECNTAIDAKNTTTNHSINQSTWNAFYLPPNPNAKEYCAASPCDNLVDEVDATPHSSWSFHIKRWTGREVVTIDNAVRDETTPLLTSTFNADCDYEDSAHPWN